jgi:hypothetical protein
LLIEKKNVSMLPVSRGGGLAALGGALRKGDEEGASLKLVVPHCSFGSDQGNDQGSSGLDSDVESVMTTMMRATADSEASSPWRQRAARSDAAL